MCTKPAHRNTSKCRIEKSQNQSKNNLRKRCTILEQIRQVIKQWSQNPSNSHQTIVNNRGQKKDANKSIKNRAWKLWKPTQKKRPKAKGSKHHSTLFPNIFHVHPKIIPNPSHLPKSIQSSSQIHPTSTNKSILGKGRESGCHEWIP